MGKKFVIEQSRLRGRLRVSGAKNSALRLLAASILSREPVQLVNCPSQLGDVHIHLEMLRRLGKSIECSDEVVRILEEGDLERELMWEGRSIRNTLLILGALTARYGEGCVPLPGGCNLGSERGYDFHALLLDRLGARVWQDATGSLRASARGRLRGAEIVLPMRSTGATENAMICGSLAEGSTTVWNPHVTPEVLDLARFLTQMGAGVEVHGQERIVVHGVEKLHGASFSVMPDRMEAMTWTVAACVTSGEVHLLDVPVDALVVPFEHLRHSGVRFLTGDDGVFVSGQSRCTPISVGTGSHPAIHSDMQPLLAVFGAMARGRSEVVDLRYPQRFSYAEELRRFGVAARVEDGRLLIDGRGRLEGAKVTARDLRGGAALAVAALAAEGQSEVLDAWQIERGYDRFVQKVRTLGGTIELIEE